VTTRREARAVEQALIHHHGLGRNGGTLWNKINSISPLRKWHDDALELGKTILRERNYPGF
jgi:filamentous hemagglutinin